MSPAVPSLVRAALVRAARSSRPPSKRASALSHALNASDQLSFHRLRLRYRDQVHVSAVLLALIVILHYRGQRREAIVSLIIALIVLEDCDKVEEMANRILTTYNDGRPILSLLVTPVRLSWSGV